MRASVLTFLRRAAVAWTLCLGIGVVIAVPPMEQAEAKRKRRKKRSRHRVKNKPDIKKGELAPKEEFGLDEDLSKTKDLKPATDERDRPTLTPTELRGKTLEDMVEDKLDEEISLARQLLELESDCKEGASVRFRLADLYWEKSKRAFFKSEDFETSKKQRDYYKQQMKKLQNYTIDHYKRIVDECSGYGDYAKVLFFLGSALAELGREREGASYFQRIIKEYPNSEWVGNAWFMVGEYYFNVDNNAHKALRAYKRAEQYEGSSTYGFAIYKQGWCHINTGDWDLALERFRRVITISEDRLRNMDERGRVSLRREGLKDYVRAYAHVGDAKRAFRNFVKIGGKKDVVWMMENLGKWYINMDNHSDIVVVYRDLIKHFPKSPRLPLFQGRIVDAVAKLDKRATVTQSKLLTEYFDRVRSRVEKGEWDGDPKEKEQVLRDLKEAEEIAENTLRGLAMEFHKEAKKLHGRPADQTYKLAHDLYKHYLAVFPKPNPDAEVNYVFFMRFYFAEVLFHIEKFEDAAKNYDIVVDMNPNPKDKKQKEIVIAAAENSVHAYRELVSDLDRKNPPEISGTEPKPIPEIKKKLIHSCQRYIKYAHEGEKIVEIRYVVAYTYYTYNHFDQAAPAFNDIVANHPSHDKACYAANLTLDIYNGEKNYAALRDTARSYLKNDDLACEQEDREKFAKIEQQSAFKYIKDELEDQGRHLAAAKAYLQYYKQYPKGDFADDAVYNAAVCYDLAQRLDKANEVREFLVNKMPDADDGLKQETLYNIAQSYERIVDFERAAHYLELYAKEYPKDDKSKNALYNAGLYRATLRDYQNSRRNRMEYIERYPKEDDVHKVSFSICEALEDEARMLERQAKRRGRGRDLDRAILKKWEAAHNCYYDYIRNKSYVERSTDMLCFAQFRRGEIMREKTRYNKGYLDQKEYLIKNWPRWKAKYGLKELPRCAEALAEIHFRDLVEDFKRYRGMTIAEINPTPKGKKRFDESVKTKVEMRDKLIEQYKNVVEFGDAQWALAALFHIGELYRDSVEKLLAAPVPNKVAGYQLTEDDKAQLRQQLKEMTGPAEQSAIEAYGVCVNKANELGVYNKWSLRARERLESLRPEAYPPLEELVVAVDFKDGLTVSRNSTVIPDGESWRSLDAGLSADGIKPGDEGAEQDDAGDDAEEVEEAESEPEDKGGSRRKRRGRRRGRARNN